VPDATQAAVDIVPVANPNGAVKQRKRRRSATRARHRDVVVARSSEEHPVSRIEVVGHHPERMGETGKAVRDASTEKKFLEKALERVEREEPRRHRVVEAVELFPEILGGRRPRGEALHAAAKSPNAGHDRAPPFVEVGPHQVRSFEGKVVVGRVEQGSVQALDG